MKIEEEIFLEDDIEILDIIEFGFPKQIYKRPNYIQDMDEMAFFRRFRLTKEAAVAVLELIEDRLEFENDLNNSVSPINQLLTALLYYASNGHQVNVADFMQMNQGTASRIIKKVSEAVASLHNTFIKIPATRGGRISLQNNFYSLARFPRVIGSIDCTHIRIRSPGGEDGEVYRNRKSYFSLNVQVVCDSNLEIINIVARWPGSNHDSTIFNNSRLRMRFEAGKFGNSILLGDGGYPLKPYLLTPLTNAVTQAQQLYNKSHIRTRNTVERTFGVWKRRFPVLCYGVRCKVETTLSIIVATAVLHNIARRMNNDVPPPPIGINAEELDYLIEQGQIAPLNLHHNIQHDFRNELVDNYFAHL